MTALKHYIRSYFISILVFSLFITLFYHIYTLFFTNNLSNIFYVLSKENSFFLFSVFLLQYINSISFEILKIWVCAPLQSGKNGVENLVKEKLPSYNRFVFVHYYQSLIYRFEKIIHLEKENSFDNNYLCSNEVLILCNLGYQ
jgi:hypothetical protein